MDIPLPHKSATPVRITVCGTCTNTAQSGEAGLGVGSELYSMIKRALKERPKFIELASQRCLMACTEGCVLSIAAEGKMQYLLGRLKPTENLIEQLLDFVHMYAEAPTGVTPNHEWPPLIGMHFLGRIPPFTPTEADWRDDGCNL